MTNMIYTAMPALPKNIIPMQLFCQANGMPTR